MQLLFTIYRNVGLNWNAEFYHHGAVQCSSTKHENTVKLIGKI